MSTPSDPSVPSNPAEERLREGDVEALSEVFEAYRPRFERLVNTRLDRRLRGRVDAADILQDAFVTASRKVEKRSVDPELPVFLWLRLVVVESLLEFHRRHLGTQKRNPRLEVRVATGPTPVTDSYSIAAQLLGSLTTASEKLMRAERRFQVQAAIEALDPLDHEVLVLRHFEELTNAEAATVLGIQPSAASSRYFRALKRLKEALDPPESR